MESNLTAEQMHYIPDILIAEGVPGLYTSARPPPDLVREMMPLAYEGIPTGYFGVVRPTTRCTETNKWLYPYWCA